METNYLILAIAVCAICTFLLRAIPFLLFSGKKELPPMINYIGDTLPSAIMVILVIYCLKGINFFENSRGIPELLSVASVALLHIWKRNILLSIGFGTILYMVLIQFVF